VEPFYFTPFGKKRLQEAPEAARKALSNGALVCAHGVCAACSLLFPFLSFLETSKYARALQWEKKKLSNEFDLFTLACGTVVAATTS